MLRDKTHLGVSGSLYYWEGTPAMEYLQGLPEAQAKGNDHGRVS